VDIVLSGKTKRKAVRLTVHEACVREGEERLGHASPTSGQCGHCKEALGESAGVVVQTWSDSAKSRMPTQQQKAQRSAY
jgi:hypothetical protein